ncbi:hypothetical protein KFE25_009407 [Diacronema lutheri]|uniref:Uncharacterized protein n=1 Tax=Diacronema lutheri TaxID=2081491 RepID=A0A8J5XXR8_DIALT|nr:hypothetical protein KFE25_009407 [Diacronema lutheri]
MGRAPPADKLPAVLGAIADAHAALSTAYAQLSDPALIDSLDAAGLDRSVAQELGTMAGAHSAAAAAAARGIREIEIGRVAALQGAVKAQRDRTEVLRLAHAKARDAAAKKKDAKADQAERTAREQLEKVQGDLASSEALVRQYAAAVTQASLRELAHAECTMHAACLERSSAAFVAIPQPRLAPE